MGNEVVAKGCGNCGHGTTNEHGTINCPYDDGEAQNLANYCEEWCERGSLKARLARPVDEGDSGVPSTSHTEPALGGIVTAAADEAMESIEESTSSLTPIFNIYDLAGYADSEADAIRRCYEHMQAKKDGEPGFDLSVRFAEDGIIKAKVRVKLPNDVKWDLPETAYVRENGTFRVTAAKQETLFDEGRKSGNVQATRGAT